MAIKLADTLTPMADFPAVEAKDVAFSDNKTLQDKYDNGELGGGGTADVPIEKIKVNGVEQTPVDKVVDITVPEAYDDTEVKSQIQEVANGLMDSVGYSADYKTIDIIAKNGVKKSVNVAPIISHASITELSDVDTTNKATGKALVYNEVTNKHEYATISGTDEKVKMDASSDSKYLSELLDNVTIANENGELKVKKLDGQEVTITEINYLKGLTMNVMDLVNMFSNGGVKIINTPVATYAELLTLDKSSFIEGISYLVYVLADENHDNAKTTYLVDKDSETPTYFGFADSQRDFTTNPIDLATEITGKLGISNMDSDAIKALFTVDDTYKTETATNNAFSTHGAKALYGELLLSIGGKANDSDLTTHKDDTNIHVSTTEKDNWNGKADASDLTAHTDDADVHITADERTKWNDTADKVDGADLVKKADIVTTTLDENATIDEIYSGKAIYDAIKANCVGKETVLYDSAITSPGTYTLNDNVNNYDLIVISHSSGSNNFKQSTILTKNEISTCNNSSNQFLCVHGNGGATYYATGYFNGDKIIAISINTEYITSIVGYKFGEVTVQNTITNPSPGASYSTDEQLTGGTWIDGKPIYRKVIVVDNSTATSETFKIFKDVDGNLTTINCYNLPVNLSSCNIDKILKIGGYADDSNNVCAPIPVYYSSLQFITPWYDGKTKILNIRSNGYSAFTLSVVIEYTKATE